MAFSFIIGLEILESRNFSGVETKLNFWHNLGLYFQCALWGVLVKSLGFEVVLWQL